ncbi:MAG: hypothetical protein ACT4NU_06440 [Chromatiales bacterium]
MKTKYGSSGPVRGQLPVLLATTPLAVAELLHDAQPFAVCLGPALERQVERVIKVRVQALWDSQRLRTQYRHRRPDANEG